MEKDHILAEIRRTAAGNDGRALGKDRFFSETGIKQSDWRGRYWVRWSDAVKEAGLEPNTMTTARDDEHVLACLASLARELGHFPVWGELLMKSRSSPGFPSGSVFRRMGRMWILAEKLQSWSNARGESDISAMCDAAMARLQPATSDIDASGRKVEHGFVYLIKSGRHFKIGRTNSVGRRERELAIQLPERAGVVHSIRTDDPAGIEDYWHRRFASRRRNGEWFELSAQVWQRSGAGSSCSVVARTAAHDARFAPASEPPGRWADRRRV